MTLPFRRRHNDAEATHDRARALGSRRFLEALDADEERWLTRHLDACTECRRENAAVAADRELLRSLRDEPIEPPRDLWAKTSAALDVAARRSPLLAGRRPFWRSIPVGAAAGVFVLVVVVGALLPGILPRPAHSSPIAAVRLTPGPTPIDVAAVPIPALKSGPDGSWDLFFTDINQVCPRSSPDCVPPPGNEGGSNLNLAGAKASTVTLSPHNDQLVFESEAGAASAGKIFVIPVKPSGGPSAPPATPSAESPSPAPSGGAPGSPAPTPFGAVEIASGVTVVGVVAYSPDGKWLAFSAAPKDGSTGPDLYLYAAGSRAATLVSSDHQTYFSAWLGTKVLASRITSPLAGASGEPGASGPGNNGKGGNNGNGNGGNNGNGNGGNAPGGPLEGRASSFLYDPETGVETDLAQPDVWMPVVDREARFVAYWSGTLRSTDGISWGLGDGQLVLDGWVEGSSAPTSSAPAPTSEAPAITGPAGHSTPIVTGHVEDFEAKFDPEGIRLAVWVSEHAGATDGRLSLVVIDPATGAIQPDPPLSGEPALRRFSIDVNRLAWVSPSGQDGHESELQVLGWSGATFGKIQSEPEANLQVLR